MQPQLKADGSPVKILVFSDLVIQSGFGRIINSVTRKCWERGWQFVGASLLWPGYPFNNLVPFPVVPLGAKDPNMIWQQLANFIASENPDVVVVAQDFPYSVQTFHALGVDWSQKKFICITPIDGTPVHPQWLELVDLIDGTMVISRFGVEAMRKAGKQVDLLHPGVDTNEFYPAEDEEEKKALRARAGIPDNAFVTGSFMMNQGRKMVSQTIAQFVEFAHDKPDAYLLMDMDKASPAGWDIPSLLKQLDTPQFVIDRILYRETIAQRAPELGLRERYVLCDVTAQFAHREGFGLPNLESMACKVPAMVMDWCSGSEIAGGGKGILIRRLDYMENGTWGGAKDAFPDLADWQTKWNKIYYDRDLLSEIASKGYRWAKRQTWDIAANQFEAVLKRVVNEQKKERKTNEHDNRINHPTPTLADTGDSRANPAPILATLDDQHRSPDIQQSADSIKEPIPTPEDGGLEVHGDTPARRRKPGV